MDIEIDKDNIDLINTYKEINEYLNYLNNNLIEDSEEAENES